MSPYQPIRDDSRFAAGKIAFFQYLTVGVFLFLIAGFWDLQVQNEDIYNERAEKNRIKSVPILAPRGKIVDRDGRVIVDNHPTFSLLLSRETLKDEHLKPISEGLNLSEKDLQDRLRRFKARPRYEPIIIKEELTAGELAFVESHRDMFPEMELIEEQRRLYPTSGLAAHVIGYVGEVSEIELNTADFARFNPGDVIGKTGIEREYNDTLMGVDGGRQVVVDNRGFQREVFALKEAVPGNNLQLTIDLDLQAVAELAMEGKRGAVVALDPRNGDILAMVSRPTFDPNKFAGRIRTEDWNEIMDNPDRPLLNRAIQAQFAPGSTFKPIMALAGLETGVAEDLQVTCAGSAMWYGRPFKCHKKGGHGRIGLHGAIVGSCDVFFYALGNRLGIDTIAKYADMAGLGHKTGVDLPHEAEGIVPSTAWKLRTAREKWYAGETISVSIGQGALTVTPIQLAYAIGGLANGGVWMKPHVVRESKTMEPARRANINIENAMQVVNGMYGVVNEGGTAALSRIPGLEFCGKTGSAQLASNEFLKGTAAGREMKDNAWFVGFAPKQPEIVIAVLFEGGQHGNFAAPIARDIIKAYFDKKARKEQKLPLIAQAWSGP
jgi:penicillin-binding protein 2